MDSREITASLSRLTRALRERFADERAAAYMQIDPDGEQPFQVWLHAATISATRCIHIDASTAERALWVASDYLAIDGPARALQWLDEPEWVEASWSEPGGIPNGVLHAAGLKQEAAQLWIAEHPEAVAAERAARREATYRAYMQGAETAFASSRRRA